nr:MAG TPA: hypothetical protein [Caudoviricetes sp.]
MPLAVVAVDIDMSSNPLILSTDAYQLGKFILDGRRDNVNTDYIWAHWIAICNK